VEQLIETPQGTVYLKGQLTDHQTRCVHYHSDRDIVAIRFRCCNTYYPCHKCHEEVAGHQALTWPKALYHRLAVLCGACKNQLTILQYLACGHKCPFCGAAFNPNCAGHYHLYFEP